MKSTGPILAIGAITLANMTVFNRMPLDPRVPIATLVAAGLFGLAEKAYAPAAVGAAYVALATTVFVPVGGAPAPVQSAQAWWHATSGGGGSAGPRYVNT